MDLTALSKSGGSRLGSRTAGLAVSLLSSIFFTRGSLTGQRSVTAHGSLYGAAWSSRTAYALDMSVGSARSRVEDVHKLAKAMPHVTVEPGSHGNPVYQVGGKSFIFFRNPRADATDPETGERYPDVIVFWVASESDKQAMVQDPASPFFTTPHFDGHPSVLLRSSRISELAPDELAEVVQDAWLARASERRRATWLAARAAR